MQRTADNGQIAAGKHRFSPFSDRFRTVFQPFIDRFSPFLPFSKNRPRRVVTGTSSVVRSYLSLRIGSRDSCFAQPPCNGPPTTDNGQTTAAGVILETSCGRIFQ